MHLKKIIELQRNQFLSHIILSYNTMKSKSWQKSIVKNIEFKNNDFQDEKASKDKYRTAKKSIFKPNPIEL